MTDRDGPVSATPDREDFRDWGYVPSGWPVPDILPVEAYEAIRLPVLDQGQENSCTGFALAAVIHFLRTRRSPHDRVRVSARMLYENARLNDEKRGVDYPGSTARGAIRGWHKRGVCSEKLWPYKANDDAEPTHSEMRARLREARIRPLGAYRRVVEKRDVGMVRAALADVGVLYATVDVHPGWKRVGPDGLIRWTEDTTGCHGVAVVACDTKGFWIQNSKGRDWGRGGLGRIAFEDWEANVEDVWLAQLYAPTPPAA